MADNAVTAAVKKIKRALRPVKLTAELMYLRTRCRKNHPELTDAQYREYTDKMLHLTRVYPRLKDVWIHARSFMADEVVPVYNSMTLSDDPMAPVLIVAVKNDLDRIRLLYEHYRALGVHQFIIIDNNSTDGTREFACTQPDTRVYLVRADFQTAKKDGWIESVISRTGKNRWYIVVDSDELLDYPGSENHTIEDLIHVAHARGAQRIQALTVDMYAEGPLFTVDCEYQDIPRHFCWFDSDTYESEKVRGETIDMIFGGCRKRVLHSSIWLLKSPVFYYGSDTYVLNAHFQYPIMNRDVLPLYMVIRHYKFLQYDKATYFERVRQKNFAGGSKYYREILESYENATDVTFMYEGSCKYESSLSLSAISELQPINWENADS